MKTAATSHHQVVSSTFNVSRGDLPITCPQGNEKVYALHPRVVMNFDKSGIAVCPYCGIRYHLAD